MVETEGISHVPHKLRRVTLRREEITDILGKQHTLINELQIPAASTSTQHLIENTLPSAFPRTTFTPDRLLQSILYILKLIVVIQVHLIITGETNENVMKHSLLDIYSEYKDNYT